MKHVFNIFPIKFIDVFSLSIKSLQMAILNFIFPNMPLSIIPSIGTIPSFLYVLSSLRPLFITVVVPLIAPLLSVIVRIIISKIVVGMPFCATIRVIRLLYVQKGVSHLVSSYFCVVLNLVPSYF